MTTEDGSVKMEEELEEDESQPLVLTKRDIGIFKMIHEHRYSANNQIRAAFWKGGSIKAHSSYRRIQRLVNMGYLERTYSERSSCVVYYLAESGYKELQSRGLDSGLALYEKTEDFDRYSEHDMKVLSVRILFAELGLDQWRSERLLKDKDNLARFPDGVLNVRGLKIAIELENTRKDKKRYPEIFGYYGENTDYALVFMVMVQGLKNWMLDMNYDAERVWFTHYDDLFKFREQTLFENRDASFNLSRII
jgi:hypothetical protein